MLLIFVFFHQAYISLRVFMLSLQPMGLRSSSSISKLAVSEKAIITRLTDSALVCSKPCLLLACGGSYKLELEILSPTSHFGSESGWSNHANSYDEDTGSSADYFIVSASWSNYLKLWRENDLFCYGIFFWALFNNPNQYNIRLDYWNGSGWTNIYTGTYDNSVWVIKALPTPAMIKQIRIRFYHGVTNPFTMKLYELDFLRNKVLDASIYDGFDTTGQQKNRIVLSGTGHSYKRFEQPIYFTHGLYVDFVEAVGEVTVRYLPL